MERLGYLSVSDAYTLLKAGITLYIASAPLETHALPLQGGWVDDDGRVHLDCACILLNPQTARQIAQEYNQVCFMSITPDANGNSKVYLIPDNDLSRQVALSHCGGYTTDGKHLLTACPSDKSPFIDGSVDCLPAQVEFIPVK